ncbi:leucine-rich repeat domain-containing protein [Candidatus Uabimicrobium amorphum]|nr:leucine-rich repeat domain-containing protein [Candidatus Uabimicrobium amorphum]
MRKTIRWLLIALFMLVSIFLVVVTACYFKLRSDTMKRFGKDYEICVYSFPHCYGVVNSSNVNFYGTFMKWNFLTLEVSTSAYVDEHEIQVILSNCKKFKAIQMIFIDQLQSKTKKLDCLPPDIKYLQNLEYLNILGTLIEEIPKEIGMLKKLKRMVVGHNEVLRSIPKEMGDLSNLTTLHLHNNKITQVPKEMGNLSNLITLNMGYNKIAKLPKEIGNLSKLKVLFLEGNPISQQHQDELSLWLPKSTLRFDGLHNK